MFYEAMLALAISGSLAASYTDLKSGIIPNKLTFPLMLLGLVGYLFYSLYSGNLSIFLTTLKAFLTVFVLSYILWAVGVFSAGDAKEFMFLSALVPFYPDFLRASPALPTYPFPVAFLINTFLVIFPAIFLYGLFLTVKHGKLSELKLDFKKYLLGALVLLTAYLFSELTFSLGFFIFLASLYLIKSKLQKILLISMVTGIYIIFNFSPGVLEYLAVRYAIILAIFVFSGTFMALISVIRKYALMKEIKISELEEGMISGEEIYIRNDEVIREEPDYIKKALKMFRGERGKEMQILSTKASGVSVDEIERLRELVEEGKLEDSIKIKRRMPFAPIILAGFILSLVYGDISLLLRRMVGQ